MHVHAKYSKVIFWQNFNLRMTCFWDEGSKYCCTNSTFVFLLASKLNLYCPPKKSLEEKDYHEGRAICTNLNVLGRQWYNFHLLYQIVTMHDLCLIPARAWKIALIFCLLYVRCNIYLVVRFVSQIHNLSSYTSCC